MLLNYILTTMSLHDLNSIDKSMPEENKTNDINDNNISIDNINNNDVQQTNNNNNDCNNVFIPLQQLLDKHKTNSNNHILHHTQQHQQQQPVTVQQSTLRYKYNNMIHQLYTQHQYRQCEELCEQVLYDTSGQCEYAIYIKALIQRNNGNIDMSYTLFQAACILNPYNIQNIKQLGKCLFLLGQHNKSIDIYNEAKNINSNDWEIDYNIGINYIYLQQYDNAVDSLLNANIRTERDIVYITLCKVYMLMNNIDKAIETMVEALDYRFVIYNVIMCIG